MEGGQSIACTSRLCALKDGTTTVINNNNNHLPTTAASFKPSPFPSPPTVTKYTVSYHDNTASHLQHKPPIRQDFRPSPCRPPKTLTIIYSVLSS